MKKNRKRTFGKTSDKRKRRKKEKMSGKKFTYERAPRRRKAEDVFSKWKMTRRIRIKRIEKKEKKSPSFGKK